MKGVVVYDTSHGNTKTIAETISSTLKDCGVEAGLFYVKDVPKLDDYDFLILGSPTRMGTMSFTVRSFLGRLKPQRWKDKPFAAFDTEFEDNLQKKEWSAGEKIALRLLNKGMSQQLPVLKSIVMGMEGPLKEGEVERARDYARELALKLKEVPQSGVRA